MRCRTVLPFSTLFAIGAVGGLDVGFAEGSVPGSVAIGAEEVDFHISQWARVDAAAEIPPEATVVQEVFAAEAADVRSGAELVAAVVAAQLGFESEQVARVDIAARSAIDGALQHELGLQVELGVPAECDRLEVPADEQTVAVLIVDPNHPAVLNFFLLLY